MEQFKLVGKEYLWDGKHVVVEVREVAGRLVEVMIKDDYIIVHCDGFMGATNRKGENFGRGFFVGNNAMVFSVNQGGEVRECSTHVGSDGRVLVGLSKKGVAKLARVHILVAEAFVPNPHNKPIVNHIDQNPLNNNASNLEWLTYAENRNHSDCSDRGRDARIKGKEMLALQPEFIEGEVWVVNTWGKKEEVSNLGRRRHSNTKKFKQFLNNKQNYAYVYVNVGGTMTLWHQVVVAHFNEDGSPRKQPLTREDIEGLAVDHRNSNKEDNQAVNLRLGTIADNNLNKSNNMPLVICYAGTDKCIGVFPNRVESEQFTGVKVGGAQRISEVANPKQTVKTFEGTKNGFEGVKLTAYRVEDYFAEYIPYSRKEYEEMQAKKRELYPIEEGKNGQLTFVI